MQVDLYTVFTEIIWALVTIVSHILGSYTWASSNIKILVYINALIGNFEDLLFSLLGIIAFSILIFITLKSFSWLRKDEGTFIQPFIIGCFDDNENYNGSAISDMLIRELLRIRCVHDKAKVKRSEFTGISKTRADSRGRQKESKVDPAEAGLFAIPIIGPSSENIAYNVIPVNVNGGPITVSVGQILILLKKVSGYPVNTITGSIQKYGDTIKLIAWQGAPRIGTWTVNQNISTQEQNNEASDIPNMVRELAFKICRDIPGVEAKTWRGLDLFTQALEEYNQYNIYGNIQHLEQSLNLCHQVRDTERYYKNPAKLLSFIGEEYNKIEDYAKAELLFNEANSFSLDLVANNFNGLGIALANQGKYEDAIRAYDKATELDPHLVDAWNNKGLALSYLDKYVEAIEAYDKAIRCNRNFVTPWRNKGYLLGSIGKHKEAINAYKKAIKLDPNNAHIFWANIAWNLGSLGKYDEAIAACEKALYLKPKFHVALANKAWSLGKLGNYEEAIQAWDKAKEANPDYAKALNGKGDMLRDYGDYEKAIEAYDAAIYIDRSYAKAWNGKGKTLKKLGRTTEANEAFDRAKEFGYEEVETEAESKVKYWWQFWKRS